LGKLAGINISIWHFVNQPHRSMSRYVAVFSRCSPKPELSLARD
jgi:hypothetical protein